MVEKPKNRAVEDAILSVRVRQYKAHLSDKIFDYASSAYLVLAIIGLAAALSAGLTELLSSRQQVPALEQRITELTESLQESSRSISDIESEIGQRRSLVEKLREDAKIAEELTKLNKEQVDAVAATLRGQLKMRDDEAWWGDMGMNLLFTLLGTVLGQLTWLVPLAWKQFRPQQA